jgi:Pyruvate/2-oxoacid:ferredoxin oxidoreductase gamma subunit
MEKSISNNFLKKSKENSHLIDFIKVSEENSLKDELNMIILGWLIKKLDIGLNIENIEKYLPKINQESNFEAVKVGFNL